MPLSRAGRLVIEGLLLAALAILFKQAETTYAGGSIVVGSNLDSGGSCILRNAILSANSNSTTGGCNTGNAGLDTITFGVSGPITLSSDLGHISEDLTITGPGGGITISGGGSVRSGFIVNTGVTVNVSNLTFTNGKSSASSSFGSIFNSGNLSIANSTFSGNSAETDAGAIYASTGAMTVTNSTFSLNSAGTTSNGYGGAIRIIDGSVSISNTSFFTNSTNILGGAISQESGTLSVGDSTFSGNFTANAAPVNAGGGIAVSGGNANIFNSTFANNTDTGAGLFDVGGTITVTNSTFSGNGSETIRINSGSVTLRNTIVANSSIDNCSGTPTDGGNNLQFGGTLANSCGATIPTSVPKLGSLANHGGATMTMALQVGSAALDAGSDAICAASPVNNFDQRGMSRPIGQHCDIGAYEGVNPLYLPLILR